MSTSLATILKDLVQEYGLGRAGTATSATTTTLVDASDFGGPLPGGMFPNGSPIRITSGAAIGLNTYKSALDPSTGTITLSPAAAGNTGTPTFIISNVVEHCDRLVEAINRTLTRDCAREVTVPLTYVVGGELQDASTATNWTGTNATMTFQDLDAEQPYFDRVIEVTATAGAGYAESIRMNPTPGETWDFLAWIESRSDTFSASMVIRDNTNGANITPTYIYGTGATTTQGYATQYGSFVVPAGCDNITIRFVVATNAKLMRFGPVIFSPRSATQFANPLLLGGDDMRGLYGATLGTPVTGTALQPVGMRLYPISDDGLTFQDINAGTQFNFQKAPAFPTFYSKLSFYYSLATDTATTNAPEQLVLVGAAKNLYEMMSFQSNEAPIVSRGKLIPTVTLQKLARAKEDWSKLSRLRADRKVGIKRSYATPTSA